VAFATEYSQHIIILEAAVEHGFVGNPGVPGKASFVVNGYSLNKNDNQQGASGFFTNSCSVNEFTQWVRMKFIILSSISLPYVRY